MTETKKSIPELSVDSKLLYERLKKAGIGETVTYAELSGIVGRDVANGGRGTMMTARRLCQAEHQMVFGTVRKVGLKRLSDQEIVDTGEAVTKHIRKTARRGARRIACANYQALANDAKVRHNAQISLLGAIVALSKPSSIKRLEKSVAKEHEQLPVAKTLEVFRTA